MTVARILGAWVGVGALVLVTSACDSIIGISDITPASDASADGTTQTDGGVDQTSPVESGHADSSADTAAADTGGMDSSATTQDTGVADAPSTKDVAAEAACPGQACTVGCLGDEHNCGSCGNDCSTLSHVTGSVTCNAGTCSVPTSSCQAGWTYCSGNGSAGCTVDLSSAQNCGACGTVCPASDPNCSASGTTYTCVNGCPNNETLCGSTCSNLSDNNNCGKCNNPCATGTTCSGGSCVCNTGSGCNGCCSSSTTCETYTSQSTSSCGAGGATCGGCTVANATCAAAATGGACQCPGGTHTCGSSCVSNTDPNNCGSACGTNCPGPTAGSGSPSCNGNACAITCTGGETHCGTACVDTMTDSNNCGTCSNVCSTGSCWNGHCPVAVGTYTDTGTFQDFAIDGTYAYAAFTDGNVLKCALSGCSSGWGLLQSGQGYLISVAASSAGVVWNSLSGAGGTVAGCSPATCAQGVIPYMSYTNEQPFQVAMDTSNVYWTLLDNGGGVNAVVACPAASPASGCGSNLRTLTNATAPTYLAVAAGYAYWIDGALAPFTMKRCSIAGCASGQLIYTTNNNTHWMAADSTNAYFVPATVVQCPNTGCPGSGPIPLGAGTNELAVDSSDVYWTTSSSLVRCAIGGCGNAPTTVVSGITPGIFTAVDATYVYYFQGTTLMKVAK